MSKRQRTAGGSVTGGTGDVKPNQLTLNTGRQPFNNNVYWVKRVLTF